MSLVMIIEDEEPLAMLLSYNLKKEGYEVAIVSNGLNAVSEIERQMPAVVVLDWMLPEISGVEICKIVRSKPDIKNIPIIMLTAKSQEEDKIRGLGAGADDYVTKPFSVPELMARVKTNMRRAPSFEEKDKIISYEDITMNLTERKVWRGDKFIHLSPTEFRLLKMLLKEPGKVFSREVLLKSIWGENIFVESRTVDVHIRRLRKSLNKFGSDYIRTVRANGYALDKNILSEDESEEDTTDEND